jgi:hypothetical protein
VSNQPFRLFSAEVLGRHYYDRDRAPLCPSPNCLNRLEAIHPGHHQVEQNHIRTALAQAFQALATVGRLGDAPALLNQHSAQHIACRGIVVGHQDLTLATSGGRDPRQHVG